MDQNVKGEKINRKGFIRKFRFIMVANGSRSTMAECPRHDGSEMVKRALITYMLQVDHTGVQPCRCSSCSGLFLTSAFSRHFINTWNYRYQKKWRNIALVANGRELYDACQYSHFDYFKSPHVSCVWKFELPLCNVGMYIYQQM